MRIWLKQLRESKGLTQEKLANELGLTLQYYNYIELGKRQADMNLSIVNKISKFFGMTLDEISLEEAKIIKARLY